METPSLPNFPTKKSIQSKVAKYKAGAEAHKRGEHAEKPVKRFCVACTRGDDR